MKEKELKEFMKDLVEKFKDKYDIDSAYDINSGLCEEFMMDVSQEFSEVKEGCTGIMFEDVCGICAPFPTHIWIMFNGKHYDSEAIEGVDDWRKLPIFKRSSGTDRNSEVIEEGQKKWVWNEEKEIYERKAQI